MTPSLPVIIAYFSMEVGLQADIPTYSGGLGVLAGDTLKAAADLGMPMVGVTLLHRKGYFHQAIDEAGNQSESPYEWSPETLLEPVPVRVRVDIEGRTVFVTAWRRAIKGVTGHIIPLFFLDTDIPENTEEDRKLTHHLYGGDARYRLCQEAILGLGGLSLLRALDYNQITTYHMNEGHSALLTLALLEDELERTREPAPTDTILKAVRRHSVFTTHTPVPAGHDQFPLSLAEQILGKERTRLLNSLNCCPNGMLNMTYLALFFSRYINGVAMRHRDISKDMFPTYPIDSITNGVHALTWTCKPFTDLFDRYIPEWRKDNLYLRYAVSIPLEEIQAAHRKAKEDLFKEVYRRSSVQLSLEAFTIGFARRATGYKRADLLFSDPLRLQNLIKSVGPIQILYGGKAHPHDNSGKDLIRRVVSASRELKDSIRIIYLPEYDMALAEYLCSGVDLWLNNPQKPQEASGTSGMKAALNGVPSLSVLDGWWIEGHFEGVTGWAIGNHWELASDLQEESLSLYDKLEQVILPLYYKDPAAYALVMRSSIALNGSFFNTQRMMMQYWKNAYALK